MEFLKVSLPRSSLLFFHPVGPLVLWSSEAHHFGKVQEEGPSWWTIVFDCCLESYEHFGFQWSVFGIV